MPDENTNPTAVSTPTEAGSVSGTPASDSVIVDPTVPVEDEKKKADIPDKDVPAEVARKIGESHNVLIALSSDPSVDEMAAAIGLSLYLDKIGKRATAIYSGATPNALEFLKPEDTFETSADTLQDFVIALSKEKADHLRYKLDGEFVKVYITPYKTRITEEDLDFSYGDFNVDLVLALDVANGIDLDAALREHGRIMHDASIINITTGNPGKFGEIEWSDKAASSVSEMIAKLLYSVHDAKIEKEEATAFLTGIVAATNRFSNAGTTPETMKLASRLMESGANQQLIAKNITPDTENEMFNFMSMSSNGSGSKKDKGDSTKLDIDHGFEGDVDESKEVDATVNEKESTLLDDLKAAEASLAQAGGETVPEETSEKLKIDSSEVADADEEKVLEQPQSEGSNLNEEPTIETISETPDAPAEVETASETPDAPAEIEAPKAEVEKIIQPPADFGMNDFTMGENKYGQMLEDALQSVGAGTAEVAAPITSPTENPAMMSAPSVPTAPEINGVPEINYMPMPSDGVLPPPPVPPIDMNAPVPTSMPAPVPVPMSAPISEMPVAAPVDAGLIQPAMPTTMPAVDSLGAQPAMQDQIYAPQVSDPGAFKIPGM